MLSITTKDEVINVSTDKNPLFSMTKEGVKTVLRLEISGRYRDLVIIDNSITSENLKSVSFHDEQILSVNDKYVNVYKMISSIGEISKHSPRELRDDRLKLNIEIDVVQPGVE